MKISDPFARVVFGIACVLYFALFASVAFPFELVWVNTGLGALIGVAFCAFVFSSEIFFKKLSLKILNTTTLGIFFGYILGQAVVLLLNGLLDLGAIVLAPAVLPGIKAAIVLFCVYFGTILTFRATEDIYISIPFIKLKPSAQKKRDLIVDHSILSDTRMIDLAASGLLDNQLVIPRFIENEICELAESQNESHRSKARRSQEVIRKLEALPHLELRFSESDFADVKDVQEKLVRLARQTEANILTADMSQVEQSSIEGIRVINIHSLAKALKPLTQSGEYIVIKVQRYGKEARQGVGYLDDGTMVVINGGADYIGEVIKGQVLSVKHTSSGRMIFCNAIEESEELLSQEHQGIPTGSTAKNYFTL